MLKVNTQLYNKVKTDMQNTTKYSKMLTICNFSVKFQKERGLQSIALDASALFAQDYKIKNEHHTSVSESCKGWFWLGLILSYSANLNNVNLQLIHFLLLVKYFTQAPALAELHCDPILDNEKNL